MNAVNEVDRIRLRAEYEQLQREYRNMEATRKAYAEESLAVIKKQKEGIEKVQKVNEAIKLELDTELRFANRKVVLPGSAASALHDQLDLYMGKVEIEKKQIEESEQRIDDAKATLLKESRVMGGLNAAKEAERQLDRQVKVLDNRLEKSLVRFNEALAANKEMRTTIDALRQERTVFETVYRKLERELADRKRGMAALIESANQAYAGRDVAQMEAAKIMQEANAERVAFEAQLSAIDAEVDALVLAARAAHDDAGRGSLTMEEEEDLKKSLNDHQAELSALVQQARAHASKVEFFEIAFNRIREESGIDDVEELVAVFSRNEDANFALFSFVSQQQAEITKLEDTMDKLKSQALSYEAGRKLLGEGKRVGGAGHQAAGSGVAAARAAAAASGGAGDTASVSKRSAASVKGVPVAGGQLASLTAAGDRLAERVAGLQAQVGEIRAAVQEVVITCGADRIPGASQALTDGAVTESNLLTVLALVEQRAAALVTGYAAWERAVGQAAETKAGMAGSPAAKTRMSLGKGGAGNGSGSGGDSPERIAALTMLGSGPSTKAGAAGSRLRPAVPTVQDFAIDEEEEGPTAIGLPDGEDEDAVFAWPLAREEIRRQALERLLPLGLAPAR